MCFFKYRKKVLAQQEEILRRLNDLEKGAETNKEIYRVTVESSNKALMESMGNTNNAVFENVKNISENTAQNMEKIRAELEKNLLEIRENNEKHLKAMREVVEEKLTSTLNERINNSFNAISERLDAVNKGLGEMQALSNGVTDLRKVLSNVKTRGTWGEVSLDKLLENILVPSQYAKQVTIGKGKRQPVDFAIVLPGTGDGSVYLPIDVKFPLEDYQRLVEASEIGDVEKVQRTVKMLEMTIKAQAKSIYEKYVCPPYTVDFAVMYLPIEGLYAEVARNAGLLEEMQNKYKIMIAGPTTITAMLTSLQQGFKTLVIQKSSNEIFDLLIRIKKDFGTFVAEIERAQRQVGTVGNTLESAFARTNIIMKKLDKVEGKMPRQESLIEQQGEDTE